MEVFGDSTARGYSTGSFLIGPNKVKAHRSVFNTASIEVHKRNRASILNDSTCQFYYMEHIKKWQGDDIHDIMKSQL